MDRTVGSPWLRELHQGISRHIVALIWVDAAQDNPNDERAFCLSGSLVSIAGRIFILTAGHILDDLDEVLKTRKLVHCDLYGNWGSGNSEKGKTAFDYPALKHWSLNDHDAGLDYGLILLNEYYIAHLTAIGMEPVADDSWRNPPADLKNHIIVGMPAEYVRVDRTKGLVGVTVANTLLPVSPISNPATDLIKKHTRFYAILQTPDKSRPERVAVEDADGLSGAPIYAVGFHPVSKEPAYWLVAVQSGWHRPTRTIAACPVAEIFETMRIRFHSLDNAITNP